MKVRPGKQKPKAERPAAASYTFPAPIKGWVLDENRAQVQPGGARVLDNWVCTTTGIRVRGGSRKYATLDAKVESLFEYRWGGVETFFAATATKIYDITIVASPTVIPGAAISGLSNGLWSNVQFGTAGGNYLVIANGGNGVRNYDGAAWTTPAITGVTSSNLNYVWSFANRLFFVEKNTQNAWYLPVSSIAGAATAFPLNGIFTRGGTLLFGASWSLDSGSGLDDKCVFVSSEGEVAVYAGTDPSGAATWSRVGTYQLPKPLGKNAHVQAGGDLLIATEVGLIPISASVNRDIAAVDQAAVSKPIAPYWQSQAVALSGATWEIAKLPRKNMFVISQPSATVNSCLVVNSTTGAWSRFTGWNTRCLGYFANEGYFGSENGCVYVMESSGADDGVGYTCRYLGQHGDMGFPGQQKTVAQMRPTISTTGTINPQMSAEVDYIETALSPPQSPANYSAVLWDSAIWDTSLWDGGTSITVTQSQWYAVGKTGFAIAPDLQMTFGITTAPYAELVAIDAQFSVGATVA